MKDLSDIELVAAFKNAETQERAFKQIVLNYQERVYWHVRRMVIDHDDADDEVQNTFIKAWKGLSNFREDSKLYTWLYRIATNESITHINKKKKDLSVSLDNSVIQIEGPSGFGFSGDEIQLKLQKAILTLPDKQRAVFNMKYFEDKKFKEIAEIMDTSVGSLKASYHHAVKKIESFFKED